jgi:hypothetical protein
MLTTAQPKDNNSIVEGSTLYDSEIFKDLYEPLLRQPQIVVWFYDESGRRFPVRDRINRHGLLSEAEEEFALTL